jgi:hypothetical protein
MLSRGADLVPALLAPSVGRHGALRYNWRVADEDANPVKDDIV